MKDVSSRITWLMAFMATGLLLLGFQLYRLTIAQSDVWRDQAEHNMLREMPTHGPRGAIYDRKGRALATSEPAFAAVLTNQDPDHVARILPQLSLLLAEGEPEKAAEITAWVTRRVEENALSRYIPLTIERKLSPSVVSALMDRRWEFPGVLLVTESARYYPHGALGGSLLGYVGRISDELEDAGFQERGYYQDEMVGKDGLELFYEFVLRGQPGSSSVVVDPYGRPASEFQHKPPVPGNNLYLTLDLDLQKAAEEILRKQIEWIILQNDKEAKPTRGAVVVQDVNTGAVLAMASWPNYDPNILVAGLTARQWEELQGRSDFSLYNWAIQGYAPGSTYKMATGIAAIESGGVGLTEQINCPPVYWRYHQPRNWKTYDDGPTNFARALATSCNPFFYESAHRTGIEKISAFMDAFGFGKRTGIDLPGERPGVNPTELLYPGDITSVAIGQGEVEVTPLQLANYTAAIAANGVRYKPYLLAEAHAPTGELLLQHTPEVLGVVEAAAATWRTTQQGMRLAVTSAEGTAHSAFLGFPIAAAGKTGSAETGRGYAHALTVAYAPFENPQIAVSVIIDGGSKGSWASPIARRVMAKYFGIVDVLPKDVPTYKDPAISPAR